MGKHFFKETMHDIDLAGQTVLVRADYNVPLTPDGNISDDLRIRASIPTLQYLRSQNCKIVVMSHLGRPKGREPALSLAPVAAHLAKLLELPVRFIDQTIGDKVRQMMRQAPNGTITLLENLRFHPEEEADDLEFAKAIVKATGAKYFVQDGFGVVHRAHASTHAIALCLPSVAGLLLEREYTTITQAVTNPKKPFVAIVGGAKVSDKIELVHQLIEKADSILIGGAMANTFLSYKGYQMGKSVVEPSQEQVLDTIYAAARERVGVDKVDDFLVLPVDVAVGSSLANTPARKEVSVDKVGGNDMALDIGSQTIERFATTIKSAQTVVWNGPLGYASAETFAIGSARTAMAIAQSPELISIIGGGDTADFILKWDGNDGANFSHVSTGGGASLELMAGKKLPGVESLLDAYGLGVVH